ncbi:MAG: hypothetical protein N3E48_03025 [Candidatus Bathyarchaeota archaeon]|nr:hypothetical protein [Candidatus Bathyarchaeota archaeon]
MEKKKLIHVLVTEELYLKLWEIARKRWGVPVRKFSIMIREALEDYVKKCESDGTL